MENKIAKSCKITAKIVWVTGSIGSILYINRESLTSIYVLSICLFSVFISGLILFSLGVIIHLLQDIKEKQVGIYYEMESKSKGFWECKECNSKNPTTTLSCNDCGSYR